MRRISIGCAAMSALATTAGMQSALAGGYDAELEAIKKHGDVLVLAEGPRRLAVSRAFQGRVMFASWGGPNAPAIGWVNHDLVGKPEDTDAQFNNYGGAERFWLGPEGGQFALYFKQGAKQELSNWFVPKGFNAGPFIEVKSSANAIDLAVLEMKIENASGTQFTTPVSRSIQMILQRDVEKITGPLSSDIQWVAYYSNNKIRNDGMKPWTPETGTIGLWILDMFEAGPNTWVVAPYNTAGSGPIVKDDYFGKVPADRLRQVKDKPVLLFKADGKLRSKIGLGPTRATGVIGSIDLDRNIVIIVSFKLPPDEKRYVNNAWEVPQVDPYAGDVIQSYNDGGAGFYEVETSSPAAFLKPGEIQGHVVHNVYLTGPPDQLNDIVQKVFGLSLADIRATVEAK